MKKYRQDIFALQNDIQWWRSFLNTSIDNYTQNSFPEASLYKSIFAVYDIDANNNSGYLKAHSSSTSYQTKDLHSKKDEFFNWIINLAVIKAYNTVEIFLLNSIGMAYIDNNEINLDGKKAMGEVNKLIKEFLWSNNIDVNTSNNQHIIKFLETKSIDFKKFAKQPTRVDSTTTWGYFFTMFSILRNVVSHNGMIVHKDTLNEIQSISADVFGSYFKISPLGILMPIQDQFSNFLIFVNDFTVNTVKIIYKQSDLRFLKLY